MLLQLKWLMERLKALKLLKWSKTDIINAMAQKTIRDRRKNVHFRQTPKEFRAQKQNQIYSVMNRNLPYRVYNFSKNLFNDQLQKLKLKATKKPAPSRRVNF